MTQTYDEAHRQRVQGGDDRLPPGQRETTDWPVLSYGPTPHIDPATWQFRVWGEVEAETTWSWEEFLAIGTATRTNDIHCVTRWSRYDNKWEGVRFQDVLARLTLRPAAHSVMFHCYGGYTTNVLLADLAKDDHAMFAHRHNGDPVPADHGGPMRVVIPSLYFWKSAKWVGGMEFLPEDRAGFWEMYGYHMRGDPWQEERYG